MPLYTVSVSATSNASADTEDTFIEIVAAAGSGLKIKRVKVYSNEAAADTLIRGRLIRGSDAGATGTAGTAVKVDPQSRATSATVNIKNGTTAFTTGTIVDTNERFVFNGRSVYEWIPTKAEEEIRATGATYFKVLVESSATADKIIADCTWED